MYLLTKDGTTEMVVLGVKSVWGGKMDLESVGEAPAVWNILTNTEVVCAPSHLLWGTFVSGSMCGESGW